jgi:hypothetical protein
LDRISLHADPKKGPGYYLVFFPSLPAPPAPTRGRPATTHARIVTGKLSMTAERPTYSTLEINAPTIFISHPEYAASGGIAADDFIRIAHDFGPNTVRAYGRVGNEPFHADRLWVYFNVIGRFQLNNERRYVCFVLALPDKPLMYRRRKQEEEARNWVVNLTS